MLLDFQGIAPVNVVNKEPKKEEPQEFILPQKAHSYRIMYAYLMKQRGLSYNVIDYFVNKQKILYESDEHHNLVFVVGIKMAILNLQLNEELVIYMVEDSEVMFLAVIKI